MTAPDYTALLRDAGLTQLSAADRTRAINALHAAYVQGYSVGYGVAYQNTSH